MQSSSYFISVLYSQRVCIYLKNYKKTILNKQFIFIYANYHDSLKVNPET